MPGAITTCAATEISRSNRGRRLLILSPRHSSTQRRGAGESGWTLQLPYQIWQGPPDAKSARSDLGLISVVCSEDAGSSGSLPPLLSFAIVNSSLLPQAAWQVFIGACAWQQQARSRHRRTRYRQAILRPMWTNCIPLLTYTTQHMWIVDTLTVVKTLCKAFLFKYCDILNWFTVWEWT